MEPWLLRCEAHWYLTQTNRELRIAVAEWPREAETAIDCQRAGIEPHDSLGDMQTSRAHLILTSTLENAWSWNEPPPACTILALHGLKGVVWAAGGLQCDLATTAEHQLS